VANISGVLYFTTLQSEASERILQAALDAVNLALSDGAETACLYQLYYEQAIGSAKSARSDGIFEFLPPLPSLAFNDATLDAVHEAWKDVMGSTIEEQGLEYMKFQDREGMGDDDDVYD
jgi:Rab proteins geranylgeranyltransferase component A